LSETENLTPPPTITSAPPRTLEDLAVKALVGLLTAAVIGLAGFWVQTRTEITALQVQLSAMETTVNRIYDLVLEDR
jgi:hypothetical protein